MITKPIIILGAPRAGTTILQRCLYLHPDLWHLRAESHRILEGPFHPLHTGVGSNRVTSADLTEQLSKELQDSFYRKAMNLNKILVNPIPLLGARTIASRMTTKILIELIGLLSRFKKPDEIRFLEKTPKNSLRASMLAKLFPDSLFIALRRNALRNIDSLLAGWKAVDKIGPIVLNRFCTYPIAQRLELVDYQERCWKFALVPGWEDQRQRSLADVAAWQYYQCNWFMMEDLDEIDSRRVYHLKHEDFSRHPNKIVQEIFKWAELPQSSLVSDFANKLPLIGHTRSKEDRKKLRFPEEVQAAISNLPGLENLHMRLGYDSVSKDYESTETN